MGKSPRSSLVDGQNFEKVGPGSYESHHVIDKKKAPAISIAAKLKDPITSDK
jgi:hypothetical protein